MKVLDMIKKLQDAYAQYGNVEVIASELEEVWDICEEDDAKEIKGIDGIPCGEGCIVIKI